MIKFLKNLFKKDNILEKELTTGHNSFYAPKWYCEAREKYNN